MHFFKRPKDEIMVQGTRGTKIEVLFQQLHMTHVIFVLVSNFKLCILDTQFNITYKYILAKH
jgi:hypothetical protein